MSEPTPNTPRPGESPKPTQPVEPEPHKSHAIWIWILVVVILGIAALLIFRHRPPAQGQQQSGGRGGGAGQLTPVVSTTNSYKGDIGIYVNAIGTVIPLNTVAIKSQVDGRLVKVYYTEGQLVKEGDPLVDIDPSLFQAALMQAEGQLARDTAQLENARLDQQRYTDAFARNAIPKQQLDTQIATVHQFEGTVKLDQGQVDNAKVQLAYCHISAPITGRVGLRLVDAGNIIHASDSNPLVVITQLQPIAVVFNVAEDYLAQIEKQFQQNKSMEVDAFNRSIEKKIATGILETLDNQIDTNTGTLKLKALFTNDDGAMFPNQFVNARLLVDTLRDVTLVPNPVIQRDSQGSFVYLLKEVVTNELVSSKPDVFKVQTNQIVSTNPVVVKVTDADISAVDGLEPDTTVVSDNFNRLTDGMKVTVRKPGERQGGGGGQPLESGQTNAVDEKSGGKHKKQQQQQQEQ